MTNLIYSIAWEELLECIFLGVFKDDQLNLLQIDKDTKRSNTKSYEKLRHATKNEFLSSRFFWMRKRIYDS